MAYAILQIGVAASVFSWGWLVGSGNVTGRAEVRCALASDAALRAGDEVDRLDGEIRGIRDEANAVSSLNHLQQILTGTCFAVARHELETVGPISDLALSQWWAAGGQEWLQSQVERVSSMLTGEEVIFPPEPVPVARADQMGKLGHLLCAPFDSACGLETIPWLEATRRDLDGIAGAAEPDYYENQCEKAARGFSREQRYGSWWACIEGWRRRTPTVPLGRFRVPHQGWILIADEGGGFGRPGDVPRDGIVLLNLADGSAFSAVASVSTGRKVGPVIRIGRLPPRRVREIGLALATGPMVRNLRRFELHGVPADVPVGWVPVVTTPPYVRTRVSISPQPRSWKWIDQGALIAEGTFPVEEVRDVRGADATRGRLSRLLDAAFDSLRVGCVAAPPLSTLISQGSPPRREAQDLMRAIETDRMALCSVKSAAP